MQHDLIIRQLPQCDYTTTWQAMRAFTDERDASTLDEIWLLQHPPVFTQGQAGKPEHLLKTSDIPVVQTDRGGQITYHGPGQLVMYTLIDLKRQQAHIRALVSGLEQTICNLLAHYQLEAYPRRDAPGVYINDTKICSIGLRVRHGCSYHGIALNLDMDLTPFSYINPCGFSGLQMSQLKDYLPNMAWASIESQLISDFQKNFGYNRPQTTKQPWQPINTGVATTS